MESGKQETWLALRAQAGDREAFDCIFRLLQEPRRLGRRYLVYNPRFVWSVLRQELRRNN